MNDAQRHTSIKQMFNYADEYAKEYVKPSVLQNTTDYTHVNSIPNAANSTPANNIKGVGISEPTKAIEANKNVELINDNAIIKADSSTPLELPNSFGGDIGGGSKLLDVNKMVVSNQKFLNTAGDIDWEKFAPNGGYVPSSKLSGQTIEKGTIIDRYGNQYGRYTSPVGVPYEQRALPYIENPNAYHQYEVLKPIDNVTIGKIAEAFDQIGGGVQYELPANIKQLINDEFLKEIKK